MNRIFVKPAKGLLVRREHQPGRIPAEGELVPDTTYIRRRLRAGDLAKVANPPPAKKAKKAKAEGDATSAAADAKKEG